MKLLARFLPASHSRESVARDLTIPGYSATFVRYYRGDAPQSTRGMTRPVYEDKPAADRLIGTIMQSAPHDAYAFQLMRVYNLTGRFGKSSRKDVPDNVVIWIGAVDADTMTLTTRLGDKIAMKPSDHACTPGGEQVWPPRKKIAAVSSARPQQHPQQALDA